MHRPTLAAIALLATLSTVAVADDPLPAAAEGWRIELVTQAPAILFPTAIVAGPDGTIYLGQDPMDMPGPPTAPIDSVVAIRDGKVTPFADELWAVMGLEWADDTLFVVHAPFLSAFRDTDGDGRADVRDDLVRGLGPKLPGFSGINDHVASGLRLAMDGYLYIAVGDKGIPEAVGKDGRRITMKGGGVVRVRPDGTGLEIVSTGERNPLSVVLDADDEIFTYGNDDDSKKWPNSLTHHVMGAHFGYPYEFLLAPWRCLPVVGGQIGGSGTQGVCYLEDGLAPRFRGSFFFCDWGLQTVVRYELAPSGATFKIANQENVVTKGSVDDFRPFSIGVAADGRSLLLVDWAYGSWLADGPKTGRLYRLTYRGDDATEPTTRPNLGAIPAQLAALNHPARSVRLDAQRRLAGRSAALNGLIRSLDRGEPTGQIHALWALDGRPEPAAKAALQRAMLYGESRVRRQAIKRAGIRRDRSALPGLTDALADEDAPIRREAAIAIGRLGLPTAATALYPLIGDAAPFVAWSARRAIRELDGYDQAAIATALLDPARREAALSLADESWSPKAIAALVAARPRCDDPGFRARLVANLAGQYRRYPPWTGRWFGTNPLAGQLPRKTVDWDPAAMAAIRDGLVAALRDPDGGVRRAAIGGLAEVGPTVLPALLAALPTEADPANQATIVGLLGVGRAAQAHPVIDRLARDPARPIAVRRAALDALDDLNGPAALRSRLMVALDPRAPGELVARALPSLGRDGALPPNDLAGFLVHADPSVRAAAVATLAARADLAENLRQRIVERLGDDASEVRQAALRAVAALKIRSAVPAVIERATNPDDRDEAIATLCALPDPNALDLYLEALEGRDAERRRGAESALLALRDLVAGRLEEVARSSVLETPGTLAIERILTRFEPIRDWRVIGPFARTTAQVFLGESSIDFAREHSGAEGRPIRWQARAGDPATGRVLLNDFKAGAGDRGGFGYDDNGSPDLSAFAYAEIPSDRDRPALLLIGSSGSLIVTLNEQVVWNYANFAGRAYATDSDRVRVKLKPGTNRLLIRTRQGIGAWTFGVQVSDPAATLFATRAGASNLDALRSFALEHEGDPARGATIFFDAKGIGCGKCHAAGGQGAANVGPDLTGLALKYDRAELIRSVLEPSDRIATGYQPLLIATTDGQVRAGLLRSETDAAIVLVDADARTWTIVADQVEERRVGDVSIMPVGLVDTLKPEEFADLIAYLGSLKAAAPAPAAR